MKIDFQAIINDALPVIQKFAPTIGAALGGPIGAAAGAALPLLSAAFGNHPADIKGLVGHILNDPEAETKLQAVEKEHGDWVQTLMESVHNLSKAEVNVKLEWQTDNKN